MNRTIVGCCMLLGLGAAFCSSPSAAAGLHSRRHAGQQPKLPTAEPVSLQGVVQSIAATHIEVAVDKPTGADSKSASGKKAPHGTWSVLVPHDTPVQVTGEATPDFLRYGLMVRFAAQGKDAAELVHELTIVTAASYKPAAKGSTASKPTDHAAPAAAQKQESGRTVIGQLGHLHDNLWSVIAEGKTWHIQLADDVKINVAFTGTHFVSPGDKVVVQGEMIHGKPGACSASSIQVTLAKPRSASKDAKRHKPDADQAVLPGDKRS